MFYMLYALNFNRILCFIQIISSISYSYLQYIWPVINHWLRNFPCFSITSESKCIEYRSNIYSLDMYWLQLVWRSVFPSDWLPSCMPILQISELGRREKRLQFLNEGVSSGCDALRGDFQTFSYGTIVLKGVLRGPLTFDSNLIF